MYILALAVQEWVAHGTAKTYDVTASVLKVAQASAIARVAKPPVAPIGVLTWVRSASGQFDACSSNEGFGAFVCSRQPFWRSCTRIWGLFGRRIW